MNYERNIVTQSSKHFNPLTEHLKTTNTQFYLWMRMKIFCIGFDAKELRNSFKN